MNELTYDDYQRLSAEGALVPVFREIPGDLKTPVSAFLSLGTEGIVARMYGILVDGLLKAGIPAGSVPPAAITPVVTRYLSSDRTVPAFVGKILMRRRQQEWSVAWVKFATSRTRRRRRSASTCGSIKRTPEAFGSKSSKRSSGLSQINW